MSGARRVLGRSVARLEDPPLLRGQGSLSAIYESFLSGSRQGWARTTAFRRAMPDDDEHYVYAIAL